MNNSEWEWCLNDNDALYFMPLDHEVLGNFKIRFQLSGSRLVLSDVTIKGKDVVLFEYIDEDDEFPGVADFMDTGNTVESMIEHLNATDSIFHEPIYKVVHEWALKLFYK